MPSVLNRLSAGQRAAVLAVAVGAAALVIAEGIDSGSPAGFAGITICGLLCVAALLVPPTRAGAAAVTAAAGASITFSLVCAQLPVRPEHTFGTVEMLALWWLGVRVARYDPPLRGTALTVLLWVAVVLLSLRLNYRSDDIRGALGAVLACSVPFMALCGLYLRLRGTLRAREHEEIRQAQRLEYARDLHDFVAHHVTAIVAQTKAVRFTTAAGQRHEPAELDQLLGNIEDAGSQALESMRGMISVLRDGAPVPVQPQRTLADVLSDAAGHFSAVGPPATVTVDDRIARRPLPRRTIDAAHHVVQESLTNVLRHGTGVTRVEVAARIQPDDPGLLEITVSDDGSNAAGSAAHSPGFGLVGLTERAQAIGGRFSAGRSGGGWRVVAVLPMALDERGEGPRAALPS